MSVSSIILTIHYSAFRRDRTHNPPNDFCRYSPYPGVKVRSQAAFTGRKYGRTVCTELDTSSCRTRARRSWMTDCSGRRVSDRWRRRPTRRKNNEKLDALSGADEEFRYCGRGARRHRMKGVAPAGCRRVVVGGPSQMSDTFPFQILALFPRNHYRGHVTPVPNPNPNQRIDSSVVFVN